MKVLELIYAEHLECSSVQNDHYIRGSSSSLPSYILYFSSVFTGPNIDAISLPAPFPMSLNTLSHYSLSLFLCLSWSAWPLPAPLASVAFTPLSLLPQLGFFKRQYKDMMSEAGPETAPPQ